MVATVNGTRDRIVNTDSSGGGGGNVIVTNIPLPVLLSLTYPTNASTVAYDNDLVISAVAATLHTLTGYNSGPAQYIQLHDVAAPPADTAIPKVLFKVPADASFSLDYGLQGRRFSTGIYVCNSSTGPTKTIAAADIWVDAQYVP